MRSAVFAIWLVLVGCAPSASVAPSSRPRREALPDAVSETKTAERRVEPERAAKATDPPPNVAPDPAAVEGDVFAHCAYGPPNYGEDPSTDAKENFAVLVLDKPLSKVCPADAGAECTTGVVMFHVSTLLEGGAARPESLVGRHVRLSVAEYQTAETGHHHSRIVLWYSAAEDLGPAPRKSLRTAWTSAKRDFLGTSCQGFPR